MNICFFVRSFLILSINLFSLTSLAADAKVLVMTHCYNTPEFIPYQYNTFKKFLSNEYEFIVFNDAPHKPTFNKIHAVCDSLGISCVDVPQNIHSSSTPYLPRGPGIGGPSAECADTIQYMLDVMGFDYPGIVVIVDSDMFLIRNLNIKDLMKDTHVAAHPQTKTSLLGSATYFLPNLMFFNMELLEDKKSLNFNLGKVDGAITDTGGYTHYYIKQHPNLKWLSTNIAFGRLIDDKSPGLDPEVFSFLKSNDKLFNLANETAWDHEFYMDYTFLHFRAGSNWYKKDAGWITKKKELVFDVLNDLAK